MRVNDRVVVIGAEDEGVGRVLDVTSVHGQSYVQWPDMIVFIPNEQLKVVTQCPWPSGIHAMSNGKCTRCGRTS